MAEKAPWGGTELDQWVVPMNEGDAAFTALDVERQVTFSVDGGALTKVWQVDDDVDLEALATDLEDSGFEAEAAGGATTFTADLGLADPTTQLVDGKYPVVSFREVTVVPAEHLVVAGPADAVLAVLDGDRESLADAGTLDAVTGVARGRGAPVADHRRRRPLRSSRRCGRRISTAPGSTPSRPRSRSPSRSPARARSRPASPTPSRSRTRRPPRRTRRRGRPTSTRAPA